MAAYLENKLEKAKLEAAAVIKVSSDGGFAERRWQLEETRDGINSEDGLGHEKRERGEVGVDLQLLTWEVGWMVCHLPRESGEKQICRGQRLVWCLNT